MSTAQVRGITGLLDGILTPDERPAARPAGKPSEDAPSMTDRPTDSLVGRVDTPKHTRPTVRRGRPPGRGRISQPKEKVTVWIERGLIDSYRDWTWQARCQLSHIVERALAAYHEQHRHQPSPTDRSRTREVLP